MTTNSTIANPEITNDAEGGAAPRGRPTVYDIITERICAQLEKGVVAWHKPWKGGDLGAPRNLMSGHAYRGVNVFLLSCAPYSSPHWLTYRQAIQRGGSVTKGEHGYPVVFWKWLERADTDEQGREASKRVPLLRYYTVFNVEQCTGIEAPAAPAVVSDSQPIERCD